MIWTTNPFLYTKTIFGSYNNSRERYNNKGQKLYFLFKLLRRVSIDVYMSMARGQWREASMDSICDIYTWNYKKDIKRSELNVRFYVTLNLKVFKFNFRSKPRSIFHPSETRVQQSSIENCLWKQFVTCFFCKETYCHFNCSMRY